jgi:hypothetical protein
MRKMAWETRHAPPDYTPDCPKLSPQALREFGELARARNRRRRAERIARVANFFCRLFNARPLQLTPESPVAVPV